LDSFSIRLADAQIETTQKKIGSNRAEQPPIKIEKKQEIHRIAQGKFPSKSRRSNKSNEASRLLLSGALRPFRPNSVPVFLAVFGPVLGCFFRAR
jgi:hypothetical protein